MLPPSGNQYAIAFGNFHAVVTEVGAGLRQLVSGDRTIIWGYPENEMASGGRGQVLCPWPNRLEDGKYSFAGVAGKAALNEPELHNAIHGLVRWQRFELVEQDEHGVTLEVTVEPQPAYPFRLHVAVRYSLDHDGLTVTTTLRNEDTKSLPVGLGFHPYVFAGSGGVDELTLSIAAKTHVLLNERNLPCGEESMTALEGAEKTDSGHVLKLSNKVFDECFTDIERSADGNWYVSVDSAIEGHLCTMWGDTSFTHIMCFTGDTLAPDLRRLAVAIEPMTCAPNALATGDGLLVVEKGASVACSWGILLS